jgi:hypothetical protein
MFSITSFEKVEYLTIEVKCSPKVLAVVPPFSQSLGKKKYMEHS